MKTHTLLSLGVTFGTIALSSSIALATAQSAKKSLVQPPLPASTYDANAAAITHVSKELAQDNIEFYVWNRSSKIGDNGSMTAQPIDFAVLSANVSPRILSPDSHVKFVVVVNHLSATTTCPTPAYSKRAFAAIPTSYGSASIEIFDVAKGKSLGQFQSTSQEMTSGSPLTTTYVMEEALRSAVSKSLDSSK
jgi:hypothetical protein